MAESAQSGTREEKASHPLSFYSCSDLSSSTNWGTEGGGGGQYRVSYPHPPPGKKRKKKTNKTLPPCYQTLEACSTSSHLVDFATVCVCVFWGEVCNFHLHSEIDELKIIKKTQSEKRQYCKGYRADWVAAAAFNSVAIKLCR